MKIQKVFRHAITFTIAKVEKALKDNVLDVTVKPSLIGTIAKLDVNRLVIKAYQHALKSLPPKAYFTFRSTGTLKNIKKEGEDFHTQSSSYDNKSVAEWFEAFTKQVEKAIQSNDDYNKELGFYISFCLTAFWRKLYDV